MLQQPWSSALLFLMMRTTLQQFAPLPPKAICVSGINRRDALQDRADLLAPVWHEQMFLLIIFWWWNDLGARDDQSSCAGNCAPGVRCASWAVAGFVGGVYGKVAVAVWRPFWMSWSTSTSLIGFALDWFRVDIVCFWFKLSCFLFRSLLLR